MGAGHGDHRRTRQHGMRPDARGRRDRGTGGARQPQARHGFASLWLGSVSRRIATHAPSPVLRGLSAAGRAEKGVTS
jgi:hypothetical protein